MDRCVRLASALTQLGISRGDVVAVLAPNVPAMYELHFGVPMAGAVLCILNKLSHLSWFLSMKLPGGVMLPDTATIYVAGFGKGGTSISFWENVYGFNMSYIGKEVVEDFAQLPIVDVVDSWDIITDAVVIQNFDLMTVKPDELDFTTSFELELKSDNVSKTPSVPTWCYGVVLWFETGFTSRFCKELPTILSTSPYTPKTHWSQTILTFHEPIALGYERPNSDVKAVIGSDSSPVTRIQSRISIVRAMQHRSIDISLETSAVALDGRKRSWPVQIFNL